MMKSAIILLATIIPLYECTLDPDIKSLVNNISKLSLSEDGRLNFTQLVTKYGHNAEQIEITTEDGYVLKVFNIPGNRSSVVLTHGLSADADPYVVRGHGSLGVALADAGYDVWFLSNRGTKYGRHHTELDPDKDKTFWDFSFHEMGYYDLAAIIDLIHDRRDGRKIIGIGHSQGASQFFALASLKPEYNERVKLFLALAPGAYFFNMPPLFRIGADIGPILLKLAKTLGIEELLRDRGALQTLVQTLCTKGVISYEVCVRICIFPIVGNNPAGFEKSFLPTILGHAPSGFSRKCLEHYDQLYLRKKFSQFDYGIRRNMGKYGNATPPDYDLSKITTNVGLMGGKIDKLSLIGNLKVLRKNLPNVVHYEEIEATNHLDFVIGREATKYLFPSILKLLDKYDD